VSGFMVGPAERRDVTKKLHEKSQYHHKNMTTRGCHYLWLRCSIKGRRKGRRKKEEKSKVSVGFFWRLSSFEKNEKNQSTSSQLLFPPVVEK